MGEGLPHASCAFLQGSREGEPGRQGAHLEEPTSALESPGLGVMSKDMCAAWVRAAWDGCELSPGDLMCLPCQRTVISAMIIPPVCSAVQCTKPFTNSAFFTPRSASTQMFCVCLLPTPATAALTQALISSQWAVTTAS